MIDQLITILGNMKSHSQEETKCFRLPLVRATVKLQGLCTNEFFNLALYLMKLMKFYIILAPIAFIA